MTNEGMTPHLRETTAALERADSALLDIESAIVRGAPASSVAVSRWIKDFRAVLDAEAFLPWDDHPGVFLPFYAEPIPNNVRRQSVAVRLDRNIQPQFAWEIAGALDSARSSVVITHDGHVSGRLFDQLATASAVLTDAIDELIERTEEVEPVLRRPLVQMFITARHAVAQLALEGQTITSSQRAEDAADAAEQSAGVTGAFVLGQEFDDFAKEERTLANRWRAASILLFIAVGIAAYFHVANASDLSVAEVLQRMAVGVPAAAIAALTTREAAVHGKNQLWAKHVSVQLKSLPAYTKGMASDNAGALRASFGSTVFSGPPASMMFGHRGRGSDDKADLATLMMLINELLPLLRRQ